MGQIENISFNDQLLISLIFSVIFFWATSLIPNYLASIIFLFISTFFSLSKEEIIFSGFHSTGFWLVFSGMLLACAIKNSKFADKLSNLNKIPNLSYLKIITLITICGIILSFIIPSSASRMVLFVPIAVGLAHSFGYKNGSKGYNGIIIATIFSTYLPSFGILTSVVPNMILSGLSKEIYGFDLLYSQFFLTNFLVLGIVKSIFAIGIIYYFFNDEPKQFASKKMNNSTSKDQKIILVAFTFMLAFWISDFYHHINPVYIALGGVIFLAIPGINIIKPKDFNNLGFSALLFVATLISLGNIAANNAFMKEFLNELLTLFDFESHSSFVNYMFLTNLSSLTSIILTQPTIPALLTPIAGDLTELTNFSLYEVLMTQVVGMTTVFFPYQAPPLVVGLYLAKVKNWQMIKFLFILNIITILFLYPLNYLWWKLVI